MGNLKTLSNNILLTHLKLLKHKTEISLTRTYLLLVPTHLSEIFLTREKKKLKKMLKSFTYLPVGILRSE